MANKRLEYLYHQFTEARASEAEVEELFALIDREGESDFFQNLLSNTWDELQAINNKLEEPRKVKVISLYKQWAFRIAAAIVILMAGGTIFLLYNKKHVPVIASKPIPSDIRPGSDKAILTLADGSQIVLDSTAGTVANEKGVKVINIAGQLRYQDSVKDRWAAVSYHTVATPRGGQYRLILEDGTKVWLNAASTLRFPTAFPGKERVVELTGEAYFEVAHNATRPFIVSVASAAERMPSSLEDNKGDFKVEVLGTHFNINAYSNEGSIKTTLLEGKVRLRQGTNIEVLKPGQQGIMQTSGLTIENNIDLEKITAWKENRFYFQDDDLETIMRQLERWYNINVVYDDKLNKQYTGIISRNVPISKVLQLFERTAEVKFLIEGNTIHVRAAK